MKNTEVNNQSEAGVRRAMTHIEQLELWIKGESIHNSKFDECCPDFSCCDKDVNTDIQTKRLFATAYKEGQHDIINAMLMGFLGGALVDEKVYIAGREQLHA